MPSVKKIIIEFDDGTTYEPDLAETGSIFTNEAKARKCGHNPPYGKPPKNNGSTSTTTLAAAAEEEEEEGSCYLVNGVVICP